MPGFEPRESTKVDQRTGARILNLTMQGLASGAVIQDLLSEIGIEQPIEAFSRLALTRRVPPSGSPDGILLAFLTGCRSATVLYLSQSASDSWALDCGSGSIANGSLLLAAHPSSCWGRSDSQAWIVVPLPSYAITSDFKESWPEARRASTMMRGRLLGLFENRDLSRPSMHDEDANDLISPLDEHFAAIPFDKDLPITQVRLKHVAGEGPTLLVPQHCPKRLVNPIRDFFDGPHDPVDFRVEGELGASYGISNGAAFLDPGDIGMPLHY